MRDLMASLVVAFFQLYHIYHTLGLSPEHPIAAGISHQDQVSSPGQHPPGSWPWNFFHVVVDAAPFSGMM
jgi:hypothetical protein